MKCCITDVSGGKPRCPIHHRVNLVRKTRWNVSDGNKEIIFICPVCKKTVEDVRNECNMEADTIVQFCGMEKSYCKHHAALIKKELDHEKKSYGGIKHGD